MLTYPDKLCWGGGGGKIVVWHMFCAQLFLAARFHGQHSWVFGCMRRGSMHTHQIALLKELQPHERHLLTCSCDLSPNSQGEPAGLTYDFLSRRKRVCKKQEGTKNQRTKQQPTTFPQGKVQGARHGFDIHLIRLDWLRLQRGEVKTAFPNSPRPSRAIPAAGCWKYHWHFHDGKGGARAGGPDDHSALWLAVELTSVNESQQLSLFVSDMSTS